MRATLSLTALLAALAALAQAEPMEPIKMTLDAPRRERPRLEPIDLVKMGGSGTTHRNRQTFEGPPPAPSNRVEADEPPVADPSESKPRGEANAGDIQFNFPTVVQSYLKTNAERGYWLYQDKKAQRVLKLKFLSIDKGSIRKTGQNLYTGAVAFQDMSKQQPVQVDFTVDFSSSNWSVRSVSLQP